MSEPSLPAKCTAEFVGTFLLIFTVGCNVLGGSPIWAGVSIAFVLMVCIYALGGISGANFNPAVSVTLGISRALGGPGLDWKTVGIYSGVQCAGGITAAVCYSPAVRPKLQLGTSQGLLLVPCRTLRVAVYVHADLRRHERGSGQEECNREESILRYGHRFHRGCRCLWCWSCFWWMLQPCRCSGH